MAEQSIPLLLTVADVLVLGVLVAARDAARVALRRVHLGPASVALALLNPVCAGALPRPAPCLFAVRGHRSSNRSKLSFSPAYHVTTE
jgi:hypothetical protein